LATFDPDTVRSIIEQDTHATKKHLELLSSRRMKPLLLTYEELFDREASERSFRTVNRIRDFLGYDPIPESAESIHFQNGCVSTP
jgi:hypothetical protein